jgi:hypothetical protein
MRIGSTCMGMCVFVYVRVTPLLLFFLDELKQIKFELSTN